MFLNKVVHLFISIVIFISHLCGRYSLVRVALLFYFYRVVCWGNCEL